MNQTEYQGRIAYRCNRCHEWAFVTEIDIRAAHIMRTDAMTCPYCEIGTLEQVGRVEQAKVVSDQERTACDERCTMARGTICVCHCVSANHGTGRVVRFVRVEGTLKAVLSSIQSASLASARPRLLAQIAEFDAALAKAKATLAQFGGYGYGFYRVRRDLARVTTMHSFAGRMKVIATAQKVMDDYVARKAAAPVAGQVYRLTGDANTPAISNGNTWAQSVVAPQPVSAPAAVAPAKAPMYAIIHEMATDKQVAYAANLIASRGTAEDAALDLHDLTKADASRLIERLLALPYKSIPTTQVSAPVSAPARLPDVREGRYALRENGGIRFYRIDKPTEGRWTGYTFVNAIIGGRDDRDHRTAIRDREERARVMNAIAADPKAALTLYGQTIGECGHCGRTLTDAASIAKGIGPVCEVAWA